MYAEVHALFFMRMIKVLIVDDSAIIRKSFKELMKDYEQIDVIGECSDGNEVLDFLRSTKVDVILMDIKMKDMNGIEATKLVKEKYPMVKVIAFTMYDEEIFREKMIEAGASAYLLKETEIDEIIDTIQSI